jgi:hypothetical protein
VWLSVSRASCCVGLGLSRVIGDQMFCTAVDASMTLACCDGVRTVARTVWLALSTVYHCVKCRGYHCFLRLVLSGGVFILYLVTL